MKHLLTGIFLFSAIIVFAQEPSLKGSADKPESKIDEINAYYNLGDSILLKEDFEKAFRYFKLGFDHSKAIHNKFLMAQGYFHLSDYYLKQQRYVESIAYINKALVIFENLNNEKEISNGYSRFGAIYIKISDYEKSLFYYLKSLKIKESLKDENGVAINLEKIGEIYLLTGDYNLAETNFNKSLAIYIKFNDEKGILSSLINLGANYQKTKRYDQAISTYKMALSKAEKNNFKRSQSILLGNIGSTLRSAKEYEASLTYLFKALELKSELKRFGSAAHSCNDICETYFEMKMFQKAKDYALKAIELSKNTNLNQERYAYYLLSKCNYELGKFEDSYHNLTVFNRLQDSLFSMQKTSRMNEMQIKYETEKQDLKIKAQESNIALLDSQNKVKDQWMLFGGTGLFSIFGFILLIRSRNRTKQKKQIQEKFSQDLLQSQEEERNRIAKELHDSIGQQLTFIKKKSQNENQEEITQLTHNALEEVRSISRGLFPAVLKQLGLKDSIEQLLYEIDEKTDLFISTEIDDIDNFLNEVQTLNYYRFIQECITNILKHAQAKAISITIKKEKNSIFTLINDNGIGFDSANKLRQNSLGLKTISERIRILKGTLNIESKLGAGTLIQAEIPIN